VIFVGWRLPDFTTANDAYRPNLERLFSNLLSAYKRNELEPQTGLGIFALSSGLTDLAEPSESLRATTAWQTGPDSACYLLSSAL